MGQEITFTIPDDCLDRRVYVFLGRECWVVREPDGKVYLKAGRCNLCGKCCMGLDPSWYMGVKEVDGVLWCQYLVQAGPEYLCQAGPRATFSCCVDKPLEKIKPECVIEYQEVTSP